MESVVESFSLFLLSAYHKGEKMVYALKSPLALYMALRSTEVPSELAMRVVDALTSDFQALAAQQNPTESSAKVDAERPQPTR